MSIYLINHNQTTPGQVLNHPQDSEFHTHCTWFHQQPHHLFVAHRFCHIQGVKRLHADSLRSTRRVRLFTFKWRGSLCNPWVGHLFWLENKSEKCWYVSILICGLSSKCIIWGGSTNEWNTSNHCTQQNMAKPNFQKETTPYLFGSFSPFQKSYQRRSTFPNQCWKGCFHDTTHKQATTPKNKKQFHHWEAKGKGGPPTIKWKVSTPQNGTLLHPRPKHQMPMQTEDAGSQAKKKYSAILK